jgi:excisionase family DNA binding protein
MAVAQMTSIDDKWMGIAELVEHSSLSDKTIRRYIAAREDPLPSHRVGGRVLVKRSEFDAWVSRKPARKAPAVKRAMADRVAAAVRSIRGE